MAHLFEQTNINGMTLKNRLIRSATWEGMCDPLGKPTEKLEKCYADLAHGGIGLIISGYAFIRQDGRQMPGKMGIHTDDFEDAYRQLIKTVHDSGGKIAIQLVHAGGQTNSKTAGRQPWAPSAVAVEQFPELPEELSKEKIEEFIQCFGASARRAKAWGFDAIQLHGAHGYLINQFLSPLTNRRTDEYGGTIDNRSRFLLEVYAKVRQEVGTDYPVMIKLNASDNLEGGLQIEDSLDVAKKLDELGIDAIEVSAGTSASGNKSPVRNKLKKQEKQAYNLKLAKQIKEVVKCPVMVVGGIRSVTQIEQMVSENRMDYIALSRPLIRESALANRWQSGDTKRAKCESCNKCFTPGIQEGGIYCVVEKKTEEKLSKKRK